MQHIFVHIMGQWISIVVGEVRIVEAADSRRSGGAHLSFFHGGRGG
jgi:hypothetical protein